MNEFGAVSNPVYAEIGLDKLSSQDVNRASCDVGASRFGVPPKVPPTGNQGHGKDNENDGANQGHSQTRDAIKNLKVQTNQEIANKESGTVSEAGFCKEPENTCKGQGVLVVELGEELEKVSEM